MTVHDTALWTYPRYDLENERLSVASISAMILRDFLDEIIQEFTPPGLFYGVVVDVEGLDSDARKHRLVVEVGLGWPECDRENVLSGS